MVQLSCQDGAADAGLQLTASHLPKGLMTGLETAGCGIAEADRLAAEISSDCRYS